MAKKLYLEVARLPYPNQGPSLIVHREKNFSRDVLSPCMVCVFEVEGVDNKEQAIACCLEKLAGNNTTVRKIFG